MFFFHALCEPAAMHSHVKPCLSPSQHSPRHSAFCQLKHRAPGGGKTLSWNQMSLSGSRKRKVYSQTNKRGNLALPICNAQLQSQLRLRTHTHTGRQILVCGCVSVCIKYSLVFHTAPLAAEQLQRASATDHLGREGTRKKRCRTPEELETCCGFYTQGRCARYTNKCAIPGRFLSLEGRKKKREK